jgi:hypothetical protein
MPKLYDYKIVNVDIDESNTRIIYRLLLMGESWHKDLNLVRPFQFQGITTHNAVNFWCLFFGISFKRGSGQAALISPFMIYPQNTCFCLLKPMLYLCCGYIESAYLPKEGKKEMKVLWDRE